MMSLPPNYQVCLQRIMAKSAMEEGELSQVVSEVVGDVNLRSAVDKISRSIEPYSFCLNKVLFNDGKTYYAVINVAMDELAKHGNNLKPQEIVILRSAIEAIVNNAKGEISVSDFKNLRKNISVTEIDRLLLQFKREKWLSYGTSRRTSVTVGPRSFLELMQFLRDLEIPVCPICSCDLLIGISCPNSDCRVRIHHVCARSITTSCYKCPTCSTIVPLDGIADDASDISD